MIEVVKSPEVQRFLTEQGVDPQPGAPSTVAATIAADIAKWRSVVAAAHIAAQ
jgi:tripartite-type tricarboxylate transporter receptor subunit TctC